MHVRMRVRVHVHVRVRVHVHVHVHVCTWRECMYCSSSLSSCLRFDEIASMLAWRDSMEIAWR